MDLRFKRLLALLLILPVYMTLLHTHEPEALQDKVETSRFIDAIHSPHFHHHNHQSDDEHRNDEKQHSQQDCLVCLIVSSGGLATDISIEIEPERPSESIEYKLDRLVLSNTFFTSYFQRRGPPVSIVL